VNHCRATRALRFVVFMAVAAAIFGAAATSASAQIIQQQGATDLNQLLQTFGGLGGLQGLLGGTGTTTTTTDTTGTTTTTTQPSDGGFQPTIVSNQFTTTSSGALNERRPGLMIQHAIAMQNGEAPPSGEVPDDTSFFRDTFNKVLDKTLTTISDALTAFDALLGLATGSGDGSGLIFPIPNAATSGQGQTNTIE
jgi:hypothetical protein